MLTPDKIQTIYNSADLEDRRIEESIDRVYAIARDKGTSSLKSAEIAQSQKRRMQRARGKGDRIANGIRRSDALALKDKGDVATRKRLRNEASEAIAMRSLEELKRVKRDIRAIDRLIGRSTGKLKRELKNQRRAMLHRYELTYGTLARVDRSAMIHRSEIPTPIDRPISGDYARVLAYFKDRR